MGQTNVNIRMDETLKQQFEYLCGELGMNMSTAFTIFAKTMVRQQKIPFEITMSVPGGKSGGEDLVLKRGGETEL